MPVSHRVWSRGLCWAIDKFLQPSLLIPSLPRHAVIPREFKNLRGLGQQNIHLN